MKKRFVYFLLSLRSSLRLIPAFILAGIVVAAAAYAVISGATEEKEIAKIGICGDVNNLYFNLATGLLRESDTAEIVLFHSEDEAMKALKNREIQGFASVPDSFMEDAHHGKNQTIIYTVLKSPAELSHTLTREVIEAVSPLVYNTQNAVFGMSRYLHDVGRGGIASNEIDKMSLEYVMTLLKRDRLFDVEVVGVSDGVDLMGYYKSSAFVLLVLICGTVALPKKIRRSSSLPALLSTKGVGVIWQVVSEWTAFSLTVSVVTSLFGGVLFGSVGAGIRLIPAVLMLTSVQYLIFELSTSTVAGTLMQFFAVMIASYVSGLFYPSFFFPEKLRAMGEILPTGLSFGFAKQVLSGSLSADTLATVTAVAIAFVLLTAAVRHIRMRGEGI